MVSKLTSNSIFLSPFSDQAFLLGGVTNRTVSLFSIFPIKWMAIFTVSLFGIYSSQTSTIKSVLSFGQNSKMIWANTGSVAAKMIDDHVLRYISLVKIVGYSMCSAVSSFKVKNPVAVSILWRLPQPASFSFDNLVKKSFFVLFDIIHVGQYSPFKEPRQYV